MSPYFTPCHLEQVYEGTKPLRIGYYDNDGYLQPSPSMSRALKKAVTLLEQAGHTVFMLLMINVMHSCLDQIQFKILLKAGLFLSQL